MTEKYSLAVIQGMISFWEKKLHFTPKSYNIILSRLLVNGKEVVPGDESGILEQSTVILRKSV